jgi:hypothetical protein
VGGGWQPFFVSPESAGWWRKCETWRCHGEAARSVLAKFRGDVFTRFHPVAAKVAVEPRIHSLACWDVGELEIELHVFFKLARLQLLYLWHNNVGTRWVGGRMDLE